MAPLKMRAAAGQLSPTALAAILTGVGVVILGLLIGLVVLLVRAIQTHRRLLADLEERGVSIARSKKEAQQDSVVKPRAVLRRNTILPFNKKSGWGALPSMETIRPPDPPSIPPHYAPPKPAGFVSKPSRLSWPFSARRASGKAIHMRKIRVPTLSTVVESPKPSPLVPVLRSSFGGEPSSPSKNGSNSRPSSDQSLLQHHPAFRHQQQDEPLENNDIHSDVLRRSLTAKPVSKTELRIRPNRSKSVAEIPLSTKAGEMPRLPRPRLHARSTSMCSQSSGNAPNAILPPLPLEVARVKSDARRRTLLSRSPSRLSVSSFESANSSILATQSSPILPGPSSMCVQKVTKRHWRNSMITGPRPTRDTLTLHGKNQPSQDSIKSSVARFSSVNPSTHTEPQHRNSVLTNSSSTQSIGKVKTAESVTMSKVSSPTGSPLTVRSLTTPRRKSGSYVTPYGSPEERRKRTSIFQNVSGNNGPPKRQLSQASTQASSTRSSNGNPFQWDPAPLSSGKPSALKGSPSARKGHRRQNCVRISLAPTILGPPSRASSPSNMNDIKEESPTAMSEKRPRIGLGFSNTRSLPRPPSTSTFAPDLKTNTTSLRASLTPSSPTLSMANYDHGPIGSPVLTHILPELSERENHRLSTGSVFSIPTFPSPCHVNGSIEELASPPPIFSLSRPSDEYDEYMMGDPSSPFEVLLPEIHSSPNYSSLTDEYDPERPHMIYDTAANSPAKCCSSPFSTIPEESSVQSNRIAQYEPLQSEDSPPCSPKTILPAYNLPIKDTTIPEERLDDTIDPAILSKDAFGTLNNGFNTTTGSIMKTPSTARGGMPIPVSLGSARSMFEPLLQAAFPSSPPIAENDQTTMNKRARSDSQSGQDLPLITIQSSPSSLYSARSPNSPPSPSPILPCSPRPQHAQLPTPSLNFAAMPTLSPSPCGPRGSPPRPLRSSIQKLRRMNSDAEEGGRGERRYLRLGREESIALPGEESWLDELENGEEEDETWDEEKGRRLVGSVLEDWEEEETMLELHDRHEGPCQSGDPKIPNIQDSFNEKQGKEGRTAVREMELQEPKGLLVTSSPGSSPRPNNENDKTLVDRSSSIWEDGEKFWHSTPPHPPLSTNKPTQRFQPLPSSPLATPKTGRKRDFDVARDDSPSQEDIANSDAKGRKSRKDSNRYRKRNILGIGTPNARITVQIQPPSAGSQHGTPGSLYDQDGFLRA